MIVAYFHGWTPAFSLSASVWFFAGILTMIFVGLICGSLRDRVRWKEWVFSVVFYVLVAISSLGTGFYFGWFQGVRAQAGEQIQLMDRARRDGETASNARCSDFIDVNMRACTNACSKWKGKR